MYQGLIFDGNVNKKKLFARRLLFGIFYLLVSSSLSFGAELTNIVVRNPDSELVIDIKLKGIFTDEMKAAVLKGIPLDISFSVSLYEVRNFWFDKKMISKTENHQIQLDVLKKEFRIRRSWEKRGPRFEKNSEKAQKIMSRIKGLHVISLASLEKGTHYQLRFKSELVNRSYPFSRSPWEFETDWYTINFIF